MRARNHSVPSIDDPPPTLREDARRERESSTRLKSAVRIERETLPPPTVEPVSIERIQLGVSVDELLYRYAVGDISGAISVGMLLLEEDHVPSIVMAGVVLATVPTSGREEYILTLVDGWSTLSEIAEVSRLSTLETVHTFCELMDKGIVALH
jgi:hypothetical protein